MDMLSTTISVGKVKLNPKGKFKKSIIIENSTGTLIVDENLFVISFDNEFKAKDITIENKEHKITVEL